MPLTRPPLTALFFLATLAVGNRAQAYRTCTNGYAPPTANSTVKVGAIRYDVWGKAAEVQDDNAQGLTYSNVVFRIWPEWFERVPFFSTFADDFHADDFVQEVIDQELDFAVSRGIDYFAYLYGGFTQRDYLTHQLPVGRASTPLDFQVASKRCNKPKAALIVAVDVIGGYIYPYDPSLPVGQPQKGWNNQISEEAAWGIVIEDLVARYKKLGAHKTSDGRPILFFFMGATWKGLWGDDATVARNELESLRAAFRSAGLGNPYLVTMDDWTADGIDAVHNQGFDAVSRYVYGPSSGNQAYEVPYAFLNLYVASPDYTNLRTSGVPYILNVTTGYDNRPRERFGDAPKGWFSKASPQDIAFNLAYAVNLIDYVRATTPDQVAANSVLMYAWNELAEGGYIVPTLAEGSARLDAIAQARGIVPPAAVPSLPPVGVPVIQNVSAWVACPGGHGFWISGTDFDADSIIQTRFLGITDRDNPTTTYASPQRWPGVLATCMSPLDAALYDFFGFRVQVVNPSRPSASAQWELFRP